MHSAAGRPVDYAVPDLEAPLDERLVDGANPFLQRRSHGLPATASGTFAFVSSITSILRGSASLTFGACDAASRHADMLLDGVRRAQAIENTADRLAYTSDARGFVAFHRNLGVDSVTLLDSKPLRMIDQESLVSWRQWTP